MNRRNQDGSGSPPFGIKDKGLRRAKTDRTKLVAYRVLYLVMFLYIALVVRLYWNGDSTESMKGSLFEQTEFGDAGSIRESAFVEHVPVRSDTGLFVTMGSYVIDGDADIGTLPSIKTDDLIVLLIGVGDFTKTAQPSSDAALKRPPKIPQGLVCVLKNTVTSKIYRLTKVNFHSNGTAYQGKISPSRGALWFGERAIWISCPIPREDQDLKHALNTNTGDFTFQVVIESLPKGQIDFDSNPTTPTLVLSSRYLSPVRNLTLCSSAVYGLTGTKWMIEYLEYHRAAGFDSVDLYVHKVGELVTKVLETYVARNSDKFFVRIHDWTKMIDNGAIGFNDHSGVGRGVQGDAWEHGQRLTRNDCYLRNRGRSRWVMFCDVDELFVSTIPNQGSLYAGPIQQFCEPNFKSDPLKIACSFSSVTTPPNAKPTEDNSLLLLERIDTSEASCQSPYNCGRFHYGREKYAIRTERGTTSPNGPFFYHAVSQNYDISERLHVLVPNTMGVVRHYAGHFSHSRKGGLSPHKAKYNPLPFSVIRMMRQRILEDDGPIKRLYMDPNQKESFLKLDRITDMWRFAKPGEAPANLPSTDSNVQEQNQERNPTTKSDVVQDPDNDGKVPSPIDEDKGDKEERFMTFDYFGGRLNNQLWTLDWVFRTALALNRTAILAVPLAREHYIGFPSSTDDASLWDIGFLRSAPFKFRFAWEITKPEERLLLLGQPDELPKECVWTFSEENKHVVRWAVRTKCSHRRLHFLSGGGLVHSYKADTRAYGVDPLVYWRYMRFHPELVKLVYDWWESTPKKGPLTNAIGLHYRSWREAGGDAAHGTKVCKRLSVKLLSNARKHFDALERGCPLECHQSLTKVNVDDFWSQNGLDVTCLPATEQHIKSICNGILDSLKAEETFFVATDHEAPETDEVLLRLGAKMMSGIDASLLINRFVEQNENGLPARRYAKAIIPILLDVSALLEAKRFFGSPASTLSQAVCLWRRALKKQEEEPGMCQLVWFSTFSDVCEELCPSMWELV